MVVLSFVHRVPLDPSEWMGAIAMSSLSLVVLAIAARAMRRVVRGEAPAGAGKWIVVAATALVPVGLVVGAVFVATASSDAFANRRTRAVDACHDALGELDAAALEACVPIAYACRDAPVAARG